VNGDNRAASVTLKCTRPGCEMRYQAIATTLPKRCSCGAKLEVETKGAPK
jgi:hypothetical protein